MSTHLKLLAELLARLVDLEGSATGVVATGEPVGANQIARLNVAAALNAKIVLTKVGGLCLPVERVDALAGIDGGRVVHSLRLNTAVRKGGTYIDEGAYKAEGKLVRLNRFALCESLIMCCLGINGNHSDKQNSKGLADHGNLCGRNQNRPPETKWE